METKTHGLTLWPVAQAKLIELAQDQGQHRCYISLAHLRSKLCFALVIVAPSTGYNDLLESEIVNLDDPQIVTRNFSVNVAAIGPIATLEEAERIAGVAGFTRAKCNLYNATRCTLHQLNHIWKFFMPESAKFIPTVDNLAQLESCLLSWVHK